ncbi:MAG TPA: hypothetical protein VG347_11190 [Verrucomicrobiae bacterium]|nr:hypothetical protein [Verrucomicrobiae bacterium]
MIGSECDFNVRDGTFLKRGGDEEGDFLFLKMLRFTGEFEDLRPVALLATPIIANIRNGIMIYSEFFGADPLPTPVF